MFLNSCLTYVEKSPMMHIWYTYVPYMFVLNKCETYVAHFTVNMIWKQERFFMKNKNQVQEAQEIKMRDYKTFWAWNVKGPPPILGCRWQIQALIISKIFLTSDQNYFTILEVYRKECSRCRPFFLFKDQNITLLVFYC